MIQSSLFSVIRSNPKPGWVPTEPPVLQDGEPLTLDTETKGLRWWGGDILLSIAATRRDGSSFFIPIRHAGGNIDEGTARRWCLHELKNRHLNFFNAPYDIQVFYQFGVDFEAMGCTVSDVAHYPALLDDRRQPSKLEDIAQKFLGLGKITGLNKAHMAEYHASEVAEYAMRDTWLTNALIDKLWPMMTEQNLHLVRQLEDDCIFVTCEMMRNAAPLDVPKLEAWVQRSQDDMLRSLWELYRQTGLRLNPGSRPDMFRLFKKFNIEVPMEYDKKTDKIKATFTKANLAKIDHPAIQLASHIRSLASLRSKFLIPYLADIRKSGMLRYSLHQMPIDDEGGTRSGRYSSSGFGGDLDEGQNIQQVAGKKQMASVKSDAELTGYVIRELFVPQSGMWLSADAEQIEYRFFADFAKPPAVIAAYAKDARTDFHKVVMDMILPILPTITRERTKDINFALIYGAGLAKIALMLGLPNNETKSLLDAYHSRFPEARRLLTAMTMEAEDRGYVTTIMGRRARFPKGDFKTYSALNRRIQGSAADENKLKLVALHKNRKATGMKLRFTVHDECNGDIPDLESARMVREILNTQMLPMTVPLLWKVCTGPNWKNQTEVPA